MPKKCRESQLEMLKAMLKRKQGVTSLEIQKEIGTVCPHRRLTDLKEQGWTILSKEIAGQDYLRYHGIAPKSFGG